ncbi:DUF6807 domain-containing protein [Tautonia plasticadhaerens]|uniref:Methane oxygenase PmoA n=1 Tax=Tautonia plasticadhaerens TaxID=2527974 RepID=A0A518H857_9BACT|nr:PmoA family protein [Tautonia plasticadhaerens]QDV37033.1 hypothetical protein ElP_49660 [Tautonia plasticadhaerens]
MVCRLRWAPVLLVALASPAAIAGEPKLVIRGIGLDLGETPVFAPVDAPDLEPGPFLLRRADGGGPTIAAQVVRDGELTAIAAVLPSLGADEVAEFELAHADPASSGADEGVRIEPEGRDLRVTIDGELFTVYRGDDGPKPYFYPVIGPTGSPITRAYPMADVEGEDRDHPHQRSFWFTHGDVDGTDFWASDPLNRPNPKFGTIEEADRPTVVEGPVVGIIRTSNAWKSPTGDLLCTDDRSWRTYDTEGARIIDFDVTINAGDGPVTFGDTKEGMFGLRLASSMNVRNETGGRITNAEGITDLDAWGKASPWVDYAGPVGGETLGVAILNHPDSFRYPTTWHVRDYGLFAANPFGYGDFKYGGGEGAHTIPAGKSIRFRYRVILHEGDTEQSDIGRAFRAYASPPQFEVVSSE